LTAIRTHVIAVACPVEHRTIVRRQLSIRAMLVRSEVSGGNGPPDREE